MAVEVPEVRRVLRNSQKLVVECLGRSRPGWTLTWSVFPVAISQEAAGFSFLSQPTNYLWVCGLRHKLPCLASVLLSFSFHLFIIYLAFLKVEPRALVMPGRHSTTELHARFLLFFSFS
jgi:hypothetical protein